MTSSYRPSLGVALDLGGRLTSLEQVGTARNIYRVSPLKLIKISERIKKQLYGQKLVRLEADVQSRLGAFYEAFSPKLK